jgi:quercetin dioxygenase-like cupin family protein
MKTVFATLLLALAVIGLGVSTAAAQAPMHTMMMPDDLKCMDVPSLPAGAKLAVIEGPLNEAVPFTMRIKLPAKYQIPAHSHPAIEHVTVISGAVNMGLGDTLDRSKTKALSGGSVAIMQPKTNHFLWTDQETIIQVHGVGPWAINYVNPADDPRKK